MYLLLIFVGIVLCIWQFFLAKQDKVNKSLFLAILFSVIVFLMILFDLAALKLFLTVCVIILWSLSVWGIKNKRT